MAYDNNINPGNPPLVWSRMRDAFDKVNENFTIIAASIGRKSPKDIETVTLGNPVIITTDEDHQLSSRDRVTVVQTEISQLDGNTYYVKITRPDTIELYTDENLTTPVDGSSYDAWTSPNAGQIQALNDFSEIDFENLTQNLSPRDTAEYSLGEDSKRWKKLHVAQYADTDEAREHGVWLGNAQIKGTGSIVDLPLGSTVDGQLIINPDQTFFKSVQVDNGNRVVADDFVDTLNLISGSAIAMTVDSAAESITITNTGVRQLAAGSGLSVSSTTGNITVTNTGVISLTSTTALPSGRTQGAGINITASSGSGIKVTNTGILDVQAGTGMTVFTDQATGITTVTNAAPAGNAFRFIDVFGQTSLESNSSAGRLEFINGNNIIITTSNPAGGDAVTIGFDNNTDIVGSVFADDSTKMVDAVENEMYASGGFFGNLTGNVTGNVIGNVTGDLTGNTTGYHTGDVKGSIFGDDSTKLVDAVEGEIYGDFYGTLRNQNWTAAYDGFLTISNGGETGPGPIQIVASANLDLVAGAGQVINANRNIVASGGVTGNTTGYHTGDVTGSVFADNSTMLVDGTNGVLRGTHIGDVIGSVFADNSTLLVNAVDGTLAYDPATPGDWDGDAPTTVGAALDRLATLVKTLNAGTGA